MDIYSKTFEKLSKDNPQKAIDYFAEHHDTISLSFKSEDIFIYYKKIFSFCVDSTLWREINVPKILFKTIVTSLRKSNDDIFSNIFQLNISLFRCCKNILKDMSWTYKSKNGSDERYYHCSIIAMFNVLLYGHTEEEYVKKINILLDTNPKFSLGSWESLMFHMIFKQIYDNDYFLSNFDLLWFDTILNRESIDVDMELFCEIACSYKCLEIVEFIFSHKRFIPVLERIKKTMCGVSFVTHAIATTYASFQFPNLIKFLVEQGIDTSQPDFDHISVAHVIHQLEETAGKSYGWHNELEKIKQILKNGHTFVKMLPDGSRLEYNMALSTASLMTLTIDGIAVVTGIPRLIKNDDYEIITVEIVKTLVTANIS